MDTPTLLSIYEIQTGCGYDAKFSDGDHLMLPAYWNVECHFESRNWTIRMGSTLAEDGTKTKTGMIVGMTTTKNAIEGLIYHEQRKIAKDKRYRPGVFIDLPECQAIDNDPMELEASEPIHLGEVVKGEDEPTVNFREFI